MAAVKKHSITIGRETEEIIEELMEVYTQVMGERPSLSCLIRLCIKEAAPKLNRRMENRLLRECSESDPETMKVSMGEGVLRCH